MEELPLALEYGMTTDEFWNGNPDLLYAYQKAYINRVHKQSHIQGLYINLAMNVSLSNAFRSKGQEAVEYPKEDVFNPFNNNINNNNKYINKIDTRNNNNELYNLKQRILEERRKNNNG